MVSRMQKIKPNHINVIEKYGSDVVGRYIEYNTFRKLQYVPSSMNSEPLKSNDKFGADQTSSNVEIDTTPVSSVEFPMNSEPQHISYNDVLEGMKQNNIT